MGDVPAPHGGTGFFFSLEGTLIQDPWLSAVINVVCTLVIGALMLALNKVFSFVRSVTSVFVSVFFLLQLANPLALVSFDAGTVLCLALVLMLLPLFGSYQDTHSQRSIYLIFTLAAAGSMFNYAFLLLVPAFLLGFLYMRSFDLRGALAMLLGLVTPFWIVLGLGIVHYTDFRLPQIDGVWPVLERSQASLLIVLAAVTALLGIVLTLRNLVTLMSYRMQTRVCNAFLALSMALTIVAMVIDYRDLTVFMPLLNLTVAVQAAHAYTLSGFQFRYVLMLALVVGCVGFCISNLLL